MGDAQGLGAKDETRSSVLVLAVLREHGWAKSDEAVYPRKTA